MESKLIYGIRNVELSNGSTVFRGDLIEIPSDVVISEVEKAGAVKEIDSSLYKEYSAKIDNNWQQSQDKIQAITDSNDPVYQVQGKAKYEKDEIKKERDKKDAEIRQEYDKELAGARQIAVEEQAKFVDILPQSAEQAAATKVEAFKFDAATDGITNAMENLMSFTEYAEDEAVRALVPHIAIVNAVIDDNYSDSALASVEKTKVREAIRDHHAVESNIADIMQQYPSSGSLGSSKVQAQKAMENSREKSHTVTEV